MRNPKFWQLPSESNHPAKITLQPVGFLYSQIVKLRLKFSSEKKYLTYLEKRSGECS